MPRDDALHPARYVLTRLSAPAVDASVIGVEVVTSSAVDLLTDVPLTPGASYRVDVAGVVSALGVPTRAPGSSATFTAFVPPRPANRGFDLYRFLPELNRREDSTGDLRRFLACLQEVTDLIVHDIDQFTDILDPDLAAEPVLDLILGELGNPFAFDFSVADKRQLLNVLVAMYREKGTARRDHECDPFPARARSADHQLRRRGSWSSAMHCSARTGCWGPRARSEPSRSRS